MKRTCRLKENNTTTTPEEKRSRAKHNLSNLLWILEIMKQI